MVRAIDQPGRLQWNVVLNWFEELKQRVPKGNRKLKKPHLLSLTAHPNIGTSQP